ncbi:hypothetical protein BEWA_033530 [Theileria equi strain WA]|uniref:Uncharacterized protein n=1 Tax=Theileria equi strain WA TaxID=1537102 RepID=L0AZ30_THEEQ|nr:hypothetical protein BEWA_033530 [Theileria equi strain WA]AFZ80498.1 hypothetical protein BEWA_033530 [Theileria equi strain WA]|eukprot:XP_004830164.1 hypothetical protein BEWA_033530 [Theileria equi strain WA]
MEDNKPVDDSNISHSSQHSGKSVILAESEHNGIKSYDNVNDMDEFVQNYSNNLGPFLLSSNNINPYNERKYIELRKREIISNINKIKIPPNCFGDIQVDNILYPLLCHLTWLKEMIIPREDGTFVENWINGAVEFQAKCEEAFLHLVKREHIDHVLPLIPKQLQYTSNKLRNSNRMDNIEFENFKYFYGIIALGFLAKLKLLSLYLSITSTDNEDYSQKFKSMQKRHDPNIIGGYPIFDYENTRYEASDLPLITSYGETCGDFFRDYDYNKNGTSGISSPSHVLTPPSSGVSYNQISFNPYDFLSIPIPSFQNYKPSEMQIYPDNYNVPKVGVTDYPHAGNEDEDTENTKYKKRGRPKGSKNNKFNN